MFGQDACRECFKGPTERGKTVAYIREEPVVESREVVREPATTGLAGFAMVKYGFILAITIVLLYFIAKFILPMF